MPASRRPLVGIIADLKEVGHHPYHLAGDKYVRAVSEGADALPVILPALGDWYEVKDLLSRLDGVLLTGSPSNVHPTRYGLPEAVDTSPHDEARDATALPLISEIVARNLPFLGICRGIQEVNVALGGTLHPHIRDVPGLLPNHTEDKDAPVAVQYGPAHPVTLTPEGLLHRITGRETLTVNSVHGQGLNQVAPGLAVEATAPDGLVEAVRVTGVAFGLAVQWHPEWRFWEDPASTALFKAFGTALRGA